MFATLAFASASIAQESHVGTFRFSKSVDDHKITVVFHTKPYVAVMHRLVRPTTSAHVKIDGRNDYRAEGTPTVEIISAELFFDRKRITIPKRLYADCFDPNFDSKDNHVKLSRDYRTLIVNMVGSDGGGGYDVTWFFRRNGKHTRRIVEV